MTDKYKWVKTAITVGILVTGVIVSYTTLKSDVETVKKDTTRIEEKTKILDGVKLDKETFTEYKTRQDKEFDEFKKTQTEIKDDIYEIKLTNHKIELQLKAILEAVNK